MRHTIPGPGSRAPGLMQHITLPEADIIKQQLAATVDEWNRGSLEGFVAPYAPDCTFMTPEGPIGGSAMVERYRKKYFAAGRPLQMLRF
jgi:hypothetical protein